MTAMYTMSTKFVVDIDSSSHFPFRMWTDGHTQTDPHTQSQMQVITLPTHQLQPMWAVKW